MLSSYIAPLMMGASLASNMSPAYQAQTPEVTIQNGTLAGVYSELFHQDYFLGVPYSKTPERFSAAQSLDTSWNQTREATAYPPHCITYLEQRYFPMSEDCLYLNIIRPAGLSIDAKLPVAVWFHGGGFFQGGTADTRYNLSFIVDRSVKLDKPLIGVSVNYRLSAFGFLGGKQSVEASAGNLGFKDQRLALCWLQENIGHFGGDPRKVTIFGESAGAISATAQILAYEGKHQNLFRGAIGQSGFGGFPPLTPGGLNSGDTHQKAFDFLVENTPGCGKPTGKIGDLQCLRSAKLSDLNATVIKAMRSGHAFVPIKDGSFISDYTSNALYKGNFAKVPILIGTNRDEGSFFQAMASGDGSVINTDAELRRAIRRIFAADVAATSNKSEDDLVNELLDLYPDIQSVGVPGLDTWPHVLSKGSNTTSRLGLQRRRAAAIFGDVLMHFIRRRASLAWSTHNVTSYSYSFNVTPHGVPDYMGSSHFAEVAFVFHNLNGDGYPINPFGGQDQVYSQKAQHLAKQISQSWINFIVDQDPNGLKSKTPFPDAGGWPVFRSNDGGGAGKSIVLGIDGSYIEYDDWRAAGIAWLTKSDPLIFAT